MKLVALFIFLFLMACEADVQESVRQSVAMPTLLVFHAEQKVEIWKEQEIITIEDVSLDVPIGMYEWQQRRLINATDTMDLPIAEWTIEEGVAYIFPNDARPSGEFHPCLRCPHTTAALYSRLWLHLQDYSISTK